MQNQVPPINRWYVITLASSTCMLCLAVPNIAMSVLFKEISEDLGLNLVQIGTVWGMIGLGGLLMLLVSGFAVDRLGVKRVITVALILTGIMGASRGLASNFWSLALTNLLFGLGQTFIIVAAVRAASVWFSGRQLGLANGLLATGTALGFTLGAIFSASILSPYLGSWRYVLFLYGAVSVLISLLWLFTVKEPREFISRYSEVKFPFQQMISRVIKDKELWLLGICGLGLLGCTNSITGYLPLYLRNAGWSGISADGTLAVLNIAGTAGAVPLTLLADKIGVRKAVVLPLLIIIFICSAMLAVFNNTMVWLLVIMIGFSRDGCMALILTMNQDKVTGSKHAGTAMGFQQMHFRTGSMIAPPLGNSLAYISMGTPFLLWSAFAAIGAAVLLFVKDTGWMSRKKLDNRFQDSGAL